METFGGTTEELYHYVASKFDYNKLSIRNQKTRWGSCSAENNISLNSKIINLPEELIEYIQTRKLDNF